MNEDMAAFQQLKWALQALAASTEDQEVLFPSFTCTACELLTDFENWYSATVWRESLGITSSQRSALDNVRAKSEALQDTPCFSEAVLRNREDWQELRRSAATCLSSFGWKSELPPEDRSTYIQGG